MELPYQLVPPYNHRRNMSERGIKRYKNHFICRISGADPEFPLILLDTFAKQVNITINLLRNSKINPKLSAHALFWGHSTTTQLNLLIRVQIHSTRET